MDLGLRNVVDDDLGVAERPLGGSLAAAFVVAGAMEQMRARNIDQLYFQAVKGSRLLCRRLKSEDVDDFLLAQHAVEVPCEIVDVLEDFAASRARQQKESGIRVQPRSLLHVVLHSD